MATGYEVEMYRNIGRIAHALERVATVLENEQSPAPAHGVPLRTPPTSREEELLDEWEQLRPLVEGVAPVSDARKFPAEVIVRVITLMREADRLGITRIQRWAHEQHLPTSYKPPVAPLPEDVFRPNLIERMQSVIYALESAMQHIGDADRHDSDEYTDVNNAYAIAAEVRAMLGQERIFARLRALPEPPEHLAEAWRRFQAGEDLPAHEARALDEWRVDCARDAGF
jgi:hypothetical protein